MIKCNGLHEHMVDDKRCDKPSLWPYIQVVDLPARVNSIVQLFPLFLFIHINSYHECTEPSKLVCPQHNIIDAVFPCPDPYTGDWFYWMIVKGNSVLAPEPILLITAELGSGFFLLVENEWYYNQWLSFQLRLDQILSYILGWDLHEVHVHQ